MKIIKSSTKNYEAYLRFIEELEQKKVLKVGVVGESKYPNSNFTAAAAAYMSEFGGKHVPARPFFRPAIARNENKWKVYLTNKIKKAILGETSFSGILEQLGKLVQDDIHESIDLVHSPQLAESTVRARYRRRSKSYRKTVDIKTILNNRNLKQNKPPPHSIEKPLIDTQHMFDSISYVVEEKKE